MKACHAATLALEIEANLLLQNQIRKTEIFPEIFESGLDEWETDCENQQLIMNLSYVSRSRETLFWRRCNGRMCEDQACRPTLGQR